MSPHHGKNSTDALWLVVALILMLISALHTGKKGREREGTKRESLDEQGRGVSSLISVTRAKRKTFS